MAKTKHRSGGFFGKLIALLLGILIGIVVSFGGVAAGAYFVLYHSKIGELLGLVESVTGIDVPEENYISSEYLEKSILTAVLDSYPLVGGIVTGSNTFGDLVQISPYVTESANKVSETLAKYGINISGEEFLALSVPEIGPFIKGQVGNIAIPPLLDLFGQPLSPDNAIMCAIFYGRKGVVYDIAVAEDGTKSIELLPVVYVKNDNDTFSDWQANVYAKNDALWTSKNGSSIIKEEAATSAEGFTYTYAVYDVNEDVETLKYRLALKEGSTNEYQAYEDDVLKVHRGATINSLMSGSNIMEVINDIAIGDLLLLNANSDQLMLDLAYGEGGYKIEDGTLYVLTEDPITLKDLTENGIEVIGNMTLASLLGLDMNDAANIPTTMRALAFGSYPEDYTIIDNRIVMNEGKKATTVSKLKDGDLINNLKLGDLLEINETSPAVLKALQNSTIQSLSADIKELQLNQIIEGTDENPILRHLSTSTVDTLSSDLMELTVQQVFEEDVYKVAYTDVNGNPLTIYKSGSKYYTDENLTTEYTGEYQYYFVDKNGAKLYLNESDDKYYTTETFTAGTESERVLVGAWKYLLGVKNENTGYVDTPCYIADVTGLVGHMTGNIQSATLRELHDDGILVFDKSSEGILDKKFSPAVDPSGKTVGEYTIITLIQMLNHFTVD